MCAFESGYKQILAQKLNPSDTSMVVSIAPTITKGRIYLKSGSQEERVEFDGVSGTTLQNLVRQLSKTADPSVSEGNGYTWIAGTTVKIVAMHDQQTDKNDLLNADNTYNGDNTFTGDTTFTGAVDLSNVADLNVSGTSNPAPVVADETARDALYTSPVTGDVVYLENLGAQQIYNSGTAQWESLDIGTPTPNATEVIKGKMRFSTAAEALAGTDDDSAMTPLKTSSAIFNNGSVLSNSDYIAGEAIAQGDSLFAETGPTFAEATNAQNIGDVAGNTRVSVKQIGSGVAGNTLKLSLAKVLSPSVNLNIRLETDNAGVPSGTLIDANATATIAPGSLTTSLADTTLTLAGTITINKGTPYHIVVFTGTYGSETVNGTNYYKIGYSSKHTTTRGSSLRGGSSWGAIRPTYNIYTNTTLSENILLSKTDADYTYKLPAIPRIARDSYNIGELVKYDFDGISKALTGLTVGSTYYISNTPGVISTTPGTYINTVGYGSGNGNLFLDKSPITYTETQPISLYSGASGDTYSDDILFSHAGVYSFSLVMGGRYATGFLEMENGGTRYSVAGGVLSPDVPYNNIFSVPVFAGKRYRFHIHGTSDWRFTASLATVAYQYT